MCDISGNLHRFESLILGRKGSTKNTSFLLEKLVLFFDQHYSSYTVCSSLASVKLWPQFNIFYHTSSFWQKGSKAFPNFVIILKLENSSEFTLLWPQKNTIINWLLFVVQFLFLFFAENVRRPFLCDILTSSEAKPILKSMRPLTWSKKGPPFPRRPSHFLRRTDVCSLTFPILWRRTKLERGKVARDMGTDFAFSTA